LGAGWYPVFPIDAKAVVDSRVKETTQQSQLTEDKRGSVISWELIALVGLLALCG
jgi:hypothetical protein